MTVTKIWVTYYGAQLAVSYQVHKSAMQGRIIGGTYPHEYELHHWEYDDGTQTINLHLYNPGGGMVDFVAVRDYILANITRKASIGCYGFERINVNPAA